MKNKIKRNKYYEGGMYGANITPASMTPNAVYNQSLQNRIGDLTTSTDWQKNFWQEQMMRNQMNRMLLDSGTSMLSSGIQSMHGMNPDQLRFSQNVTRGRLKHPLSIFDKRVGRHDLARWGQPKTWAGQRLEDPGFMSGVGTMADIGGQAISQFGGDDDPTTYGGADRFGRILSGVGKGAKTGAQIGSVIPGVGTAIGTVVGATIGGLTGDRAGKKEQEEAQALLNKRNAEIIGGTNIMHAKKLEDRESLGYAGGVSVRTGGRRSKYEHGGPHNPDGTRMNLTPYTKYQEGRLTDADTAARGWLSGYPTWTDVAKNAYWQSMQRDSTATMDMPYAERAKFLSGERMIGNPGMAWMMKDNPEDQALYTARTEAAEKKYRETVGPPWWDKGDKDLTYDELRTKEIESRPKRRGGMKYENGGFDYIPQSQRQPSDVHPFNVPHWMNELAYPQGLPHPHTPGGFHTAYTPQTQLSPWQQRMADELRNWKIEQKAEYIPQSQRNEPEFIPQSQRRKGGMKYRSAGYRNPYTFSQAGPQSYWGGIPGGADASPDPYARKAARRGYERFGPGAHAYRMHRNMSGSINQYDLSHIPFNRIQDYMYVYDKDGNLITRGGGHRKKYRAGGIRRQFPHGGAHLPWGYEGMTGALATHQDLRNIGQDPRSNFFQRFMPKEVSKEQQLQLGLDITGTAFPPAAWASSVMDARNAYKNFQQGNISKGLGYAGYAGLGIVPFAGPALKNIAKGSKWLKYLQPTTSALKAVRKTKGPLKGGKHATTYATAEQEPTGGLGPGYGYEGSAPTESTILPSLDASAYKQDEPFWKRIEAVKNVTRE